jgi:hypothetical protein
MNTKQAKDFLVQHAVEQAARESIPLSETERKMMYFTESDATSCDNPVELDEEFEAQYDTVEYETKIARLLHRAYDRLKREAPEGKRTWDQAVRTLRKGDHYFLVLWDTKPRSEHPTRDFFKPVGIGMLIAVGIGIALIFAVKYNIEVDRFRKYLVVVLLGVYLVANGIFRGLYRVAAGWFNKGTTKDNEPD